MDYYEEDPDWREWGLEHRRAVWQCHNGLYTVHDKRDGQPPPMSILALKLHDKKGGSMEEWPEDLRVREMPR